MKYWLERLINRLQGNYEIIGFSTLLIFVSAGIILPRAKGGISDSILRDGLPSSAEGFKILTSDATVFSITISALIAFVILRAISSNTVKQFSWRILFLFLVMAPVYLIINFGWDQAFFGQVAKMMRGNLLYRDVVTLSPPPLPYMYYFANKIFGVNTWGIRLFDLAAAFAVTVMIAKLGERLFSLRAGIISGVIFTITTFFSGRDAAWSAAQAEDFMMVPLLLAFLILIISPEKVKPLKMVFCGALLGLVIWFKPSSFVLVVSIVPAAYLYHWMLKSKIAKARDGIISLGYMTAGVMIISSVFVGILVLRGIWPEFLTITGYSLNYSSSYIEAGQTSIGFIAARFTQTAKQNLILTIFVLLSLIVIAARRRLSASIIVVMLMTGAAFLYVIIQMKFFMYHFIPLYPFLALIVGYGSDLIPERTKNKTVALAILSVILIGFFVMSQAVSKGAPPLRTMLIGLLSKNMMIDEPSCYGNRSRKIAQFIDSQTFEGDKIFVWGNDSNIYFWSERQPVNRFLYIGLPLAGFAPREWKTELVDSLIKKHPAVIIVMKDQPVPHLTGTQLTSPEYLEQNRSVKALLEKSYRVFVDDSDFTIYKYGRSAT